MRLPSLLLLLLLSVLPLFQPACFAATPPVVPPGALAIYFIDVEGGQSTLFVTPDGHSLLVDTGWYGQGGRDTERIVAAMGMAHISRLDAVLITHFHLDHVGGVAALAARVPIGMFLDHGPNRESVAGDTATARAAYQQLLASGRYEHKVLHPGEPLPVPGFRGIVVSADGALLQQPLPGAGSQNAFCANAGQAQPDATENSRSLGFVLEWGSHARILDLGDLTRDKEKELMCPVNKLGHIDLLVVSHHGWYQSSSAALVDAITPRVAVMDNGAAKGGSIPVLDTLRSDPSHPALWQLHFSEEGGAAHNTDMSQIANVSAPPAVAGQAVAHADDAGFLLRATVLPNGTLQLWNSRTGELRSYAPGITHPERTRTRGQ